MCSCDHIWQGFWLACGGVNDSSFQQLRYVIDDGASHLAPPAAGPTPALAASCCVTVPGQQIAVGTP